MGNRFTNKGYEKDPRPVRLHKDVAPVLDLWLATHGETFAEFARTAIDERLNRLQRAEKKKG